LILRCFLLSDHLHAKQDIQGSGKVQRSACIEPSSKRKRIEESDAIYYLHVSSSAEVTPCKSPAIECYPPHHAHGICIKPALDGNNPAAPPPSLSPPLASADFVPTAVDSFLSPVAAFHFPPAAHDHQNPLDGMETSELADPNHFDWPLW
jgi:hypothetical protein